MGTKKSRVRTSHSTEAVLQVNLYLLLPSTVYPQGFGQQKGPHKPAQVMSLLGRGRENRNLLFLALELEIRPSFPLKSFTFRCLYHTERGLLVTEQTKKQNKKTLKQPLCNLFLNSHSNLLIPSYLLSPPSHSQDRVNKVQF